MLLRDVFTEVQPLNLVLQKCVVSLCLADVPVYSNKSHTSLEKVFHFKTAFHLKKSRKNDKWCPNGNSIFATNFMSTWKKICYFPLMNLKKMFTLIKKKKKSTKKHLAFIESFIAELKEAFLQLNFWPNFVIRQLW